LSDEQSRDALLRELAELEAQLQAIQHARAEHEQAEVAALQRERDEYNREYQEKMRRQEAMIKRGQADPFWWLEHFGDFDE
jgi:hypothetical protein